MEKEAIQRILKGSRSGSKQPKTVKEDKKQRVSMLGIFKMGNFKKMVFMLMLFKDMKESIAVELNRDMVSLLLGIKNILVIFLIMFMRGVDSSLLGMMFMLEALKMELKMGMVLCKDHLNLMVIGKMENQHFQ